MNDEQRRVARFGAQPEGTGPSLRLAECEQALDWRRHKRQHHLPDQVQNADR